LSDDLLKATWRGDSQAVAGYIEKAHDETSHLTYNDENALSYTISLAYFSARQYYSIIREMPAGKGFADLVFVPRGNKHGIPAMIVELKWDKTAEGAIDQIRGKNYLDALRGFEGPVMLVGVNYDKRAKKYSCSITMA
jgi:hypothetical protein